MRRRRNNGRRRRVRPTRNWFGRYLRSADPPSFNPVPWNRAIIKAEWSTPGSDNLTISVGELTTAIHDQMGTSPPTGYFTCVKLQGIGIWDLNGNSMEVSFFDLDSFADNITQRFAHTISERYDNPGRNKWAHLHYVWPRDNRNNVLSSQTHSAAEILNLRPGTENTTSTRRIVAHIAVLWRMGIPDAEPTIRRVGPTFFGVRRPMATKIDDDFEYLSETEDEEDT